MAEVFIPPASSHIQMAEWEDQNLTVTFRDGAAYSYEGVPYSTYMAMQSAPSTGQFFVAMIKNKYPAQPVA